MTFDDPNAIGSQAIGIAAAVRCAQRLGFAVTIRELREGEHHTVYGIVVEAERDV